MKYIITLTLLCCFGKLFAQPRILPLIMANAPDNIVEKNFNKDTVQFEEKALSHNNRFLYIQYRKTDTLTFKHPFLQTENGRDRLSIGLAVYEKQPDGYKLKFANDEVFFCASCNNAQQQHFQIKGDTVSVSINWGPSVAWAYSGYKYVYNKENKRWQLTDAYIDWADDSGEVTNKYLHFSKKSPYYLDNANAELVDFSYPSEVNVSLSYREGKYKNLLDSLKQFPAKYYRYLPEVFNAKNAEYFMMNDDDSPPPMIAANNIGYFFEQANALATAKVFLQKVIDNFPKREVAYYNLGDVCKKEGNVTQAVDNYKNYIRLMKARGLEAKIPAAVTAYVKDNS